MTDEPGASVRGRGRRWRPAVATLAAAAALLSQGAEAAQGPFDGDWSVVLVCPDTTDSHGLVKGYEYTFPVAIEAGVIQGAYGTVGHPASVAYRGTVDDDGHLEITATGNTGRSDYSVGKVSQGTQYGYTLRGRLAGATGTARRREIRPCTATFARR